MSDTERNALLELLAKATEEAKSISADEALNKLVEEGIYTPEGKLTARYGGKAVSAAH